MRPRQSPLHDSTTTTGIRPGVGASNVTVAGIGPAFAISPNTCPLYRPPAASDYEAAHILHPNRQTLYQPPFKKPPKRYHCAMHPIPLPLTGSPPSALPGGGPPGPNLRAAPISPPHRLATDLSEAFMKPPIMPSGNDPGHARNAPRIF